MLAISAIFQIKPAHVADFKKLSLRHAANSLKEEGCLGFDVFQAQDAPTRFYYHEKYTDQAAVDLHGKTPYFADFIKEAEQWAESKEIVVWTPVE